MPPHPAACDQSRAVAHLPPKAPGERSIRHDILKPGIFVCESREDLRGLAPAWNRLAAAQRQYVPSFDDLEDALGDRNLAVRVVGCRVAGEIVALAAFVIQNGERRFWIGERPVLRLRLRTATLYGSALLGAADADQAAALLACLARDRRTDLFVMDDLPQSNPFYTAVAAGRWRGPIGLSHHRTMRRLLPLPASMNEYWAALRPSTRKAALRDLRTFERLAPRYVCFTEADAATEFLPRAAEISARTYQLGLGYGIVDTPHLSRHFARLAAEGRLRCYLARVDGTDVAFAWGDVSHGVFYFRATGYDPALAKSSAGKAILFAVIRDLIESRAAHLFDFGVRDMDYKERFSTVTLPCGHVLLGRRRRPRGIAVIWLDRAFGMLKSVTPRLLGAERLRRIKRALRGEMAWVGGR